MSDEVHKLQTHLKLLREEYVKLQRRLAEVEKKYQVLLAASGSADEDNFVSRLLRTVSDLYEKERYSDLKIKINGKEIHGHRFVLAARSDRWGVSDLSQVAVLDLSENVSLDVGQAMIRWVYTDQCDFENAEDGFLLSLLKAAGRYSLAPLVSRCEQALMSLVTVRNCIRYYQTAEEIRALALKEHCSELISNHWDDFTSEDFANMPAPLAYQMFKAKTEYPLHTAIRAKREDVVFLYMVEHDSQLPGKLNVVDGKGDLPIDLALQGRLEGIAKTLVQHKADLSLPDPMGYCLLHRAIKRGDEYSAKFLIENKANVNTASKVEKETPLHLVASVRPNLPTPEQAQGMARIAALLLQHSANANAKDSAQCTPLHRAIVAGNEAVFSILLGDKNLNLELQDCDGHTVLWLALTAGSPSNDSGYEPDSFAARLITRGSSPNTVNQLTEDTMLHLAARCGNETAGLFLATHGANSNIANSKGETPLHTACHSGLAKLVEVLLENGSNANMQTTAALASTGDHSEHRQTPLHLAILAGHINVIKILLDYKVKATKSVDGLRIIPNLTIKDSEGQTALGLALWTKRYDIAELLISAGANVNDIDRDGHTLLHQAILRHDIESSLFLLQHQSDYAARTSDNQTCLQLAINHRLPSVVESLCQKGADIDVRDDDGVGAIWQALSSEQTDIASILVRYGCDVNVWGVGPNNCCQTLLHRAIDENAEVIACFLIRSKCDVNSPRKPGPNGEGDEEARDNQGPLHMSCTWGLIKVVQCLLEHSADVNARDVEGKTPLHIAIENQHHSIISLLLSHPTLNLTLRDKHGLTPFAAAMVTKNNKAAQAILDREPTAAEQLDNKGRNFLHIAIQKGDIESVLFLISVHANVSSRVQDSSQLTPLHLAVIAGAEMISRNLLLAGAKVNDLTPQKQTALHLAALHDRAQICCILLENNIDTDALDDHLNNALHIATQHGHLNTTRVLLTQSRINALAVNMRGQNPLHVLGQYGKENAAAIFDLFLECMPNYPVDQVDANGSTAMLLAYFNGNGGLCRALVRARASLGLVNKEGLSIFNAPVATKQLLFKLLDMLNKEPTWCEGEVCLQCATKFSIKTRKHHCRHCGRLLCSKCSDKDMPILKYNIPKPVRVCEMCFDVLTLGLAASS